MELARGKEGVQKTFWMKLEVAGGEDNIPPLPPFNFVLSQCICIISKEVIARGAGPWKLLAWRNN